MPLSHRFFLMLLTPLVARVLCILLHAQHRVDKGSMLFNGAQNQKALPSTFSSEGLKQGATQSKAKKFLQSHLWEWRGGTICKRFSPVRGERFISGTYQANSLNTPFSARFFATKKLQKTTSMWPSPMGMVWEAYGLPGSQSFVEQIQVNSLEDSAFSEFRPNKICMWSAWWYSECSEEEAISYDDHDDFCWCFSVFFLWGGRFLPKAQKTLWVEDDSTSPMICQERIEHIIQWTIFTYEEPSFHKKSSWDAAKHLSQNCMNWGSWTSFLGSLSTSSFTRKIHHTWLLSSPNITGQFMGLQVFPLSEI